VSVDVERIPIPEEPENRIGSSRVPYRYLSAPGMIPITSNNWYGCNTSSTRFLPPISVRQVTQGVGHGCHESINDANYDGDLATYMRK
jgi:hypothetical protein